MSEDQNVLNRIEGDTLYYHIIFRTDLMSYVRFLAVSNGEITPATFDVINSLRNLDIDNIDGKYVVVLYVPTNGELKRKLDSIAVQVSKITKKNIVIKELLL
jgi:hypothetical protein